MNFKTPILFLVFNRLDTALKVFAEIKKQKPQYLYIAADGPRKGKIGEDNLCAEVRDSVLNQIDWDCELKTLFREENLGCGVAVSSAITWFFEHVEEGIILEDDCLPHTDFFCYCSDLLKRYKNENNISIISGCNFQNGILRGEGSFYFSSYTHIWGWATWRRTWEKYSFTLGGINRDKLDEQLKSFFCRKSERDYWLNIYDSMILKKIDTWDYQLVLCMFFYEKLSIIPNINLISNIGFGENSTHTVDANSPFASNKISEIYPIVYPHIIKRDKKADKYYYRKNIYQSFFIRMKYSILSLKRKIWK